MSKRGIGVVSALLASLVLALTPAAAAGPLPGKVTGLHLVQSQLTKLTVTWVAVSDPEGHPVSDYVIAWSVDALHWDEKAVAAAPATIFGLEGGKGYLVKVTARNDQGRGPASDTATFVTASGKPRFVKPVKGNSIGPGRTRIYWPPALANGSPITKYEIKWKWAKSKVWGAWKEVGLDRFLFVSGWIRYRNYKVMVRATNSFGSEVSAVAILKQTK